MVKVIDANIYNYNLLIGNRSKMCRGFFFYKINVLW